MNTKPSFDPNARATANSGIFGLPFNADESELVLIPVPWEATTSYGGGTAEGPTAILNASHQVDLFDLELGNAWKAGYHLLPLNQELASMNGQAKLRADEARHLEDDAATPEQIQRAKNQVDSYCSKMNDWVYDTAKTWLKKQKTVALVGGDHSTPYGLIKALSEVNGPDFGILHIDAHHDLRKSYEGFQFSHASIFHNVLEASWAPSSLTQVGIRDFCEEEVEYAKEKSVAVFYDLHLQLKKAKGETWWSICKEIVETLPQKVYISFDIDGLSPAFCPHTGTPVAGGLDYSEALILFKCVAESGRKIIGFDVNEVAPGADGDEWDANVAARLIFKLCGWALNTKE